MFSVKKNNVTTNVIKAINKDDLVRINSFKSELNIDIIKECFNAAVTKKINDIIEIFLKNKDLQAIDLDPYFILSLVENNPSLAEMGSGLFIAFIILLLETI